MGFPQARCHQRRSHSEPVFGFVLADAQRTMRLTDMLAQHLKSLAALMAFKRFGFIVIFQRPEETSAAAHKRRFFLPSEDLTVNYDVALLGTTHNGNILFPVQITHCRFIAAASRKMNIDRAAFQIAVAKAVLYGIGLMPTFSHLGAARMAKDMHMCLLTRDRGESAIFFD